MSETLGVHMRCFARIILATGLLTIGVSGIADTASAAPKKQPISIRVLDQNGAPRRGAHAVACPVIAGQQDCSQRVDVLTNPDGYANLKLDANVTYGVFSFVSNPVPAWACHGFVIGDQELYLSDRIEGRGTGLPKSVTFTITQPTPLDCAVVTVTDDSGNPLPTAGLFVCAHAPGSTDCTGDRFEGPDGDGVIRMKIDETLVYDLGTFITDTGWPCPGFESEDGTLFHFGGSGSFTAADFLAGITLVIPKPSALDCAVVTVIDDSGNAVANAGLFVCAHEPGSDECIGDRFNGAPDGVIRMKVDPALVYDLGTFVANTGWPCPGFILDDGTPLWFGERGTFTPDDLLAGVTLVIPVPDAADCAPVPTGQITVDDDSGNLLTTSAVIICAHAPGSTACIGSTFDSADADGIIRMDVDPTLVYDLRPTVINSGWTCPSFVQPDGSTFHHGETATYTADELLAGVTLVVRQPLPENCVVIGLTDDAGNPLPTAGLFVCVHLPGTSDCIGDQFEGPDADGIIRMAAFPDREYDLGGYLANSGWPCPGYVAPDGTTFHFSPNATYTGAELQAGLTLVISVPDAADCAA